VCGGGVFALPVNPERTVAPSWRTNILLRSRSINDSTEVCTPAPPSEEVAAMLPVTAVRVSTGRSSGMNMPPVERPVRLATASETSFSKPPFFSHLSLIRFWMARV
jgi:hypothetical protein